MSIHGFGGKRFDRDDEEYSISSDDVVGGSENGEDDLAKAKRVSLEGNAKAQDVIDIEWDISEAFPNQIRETVEDICSIYKGLFSALTEVYPSTGSLVSGAASLEGRIYPWVCASGNTTKKLARLEDHEATIALHKDNVLRAVHTWVDLQMKRGNQDLSRVKRLWMQWSNM